MNKRIKLKNPKYNAALKAISYLSNYGWIFTDIKQSAKLFAKSFEYGSPDTLGKGIVNLFKCTWEINSIRDIKRLDKARKIYRKYCIKYARNILNIY